MGALGGPCRRGSPDPDGAVPFDPGRRAGVPGDPAPSCAPAKLRSTRRGAAGLCRVARERWRPQVHYHPVLRLSLTARTSRGERVSAAVPGALGAAAAAAARQGDASAARAARGGVSRAGRVTGRRARGALRARVGVGWYPAGVEPGRPTPASPLMHGQRGSRRMRTAARKILAATVAASHRSAAGACQAHRRRC